MSQLTPKQIEYLNGINGVAYSLFVANNKFIQYFQPKEMVIAAEKIADHFNKTKERLIIK